MSSSSAQVDPGDVPDESDGCGRGGGRRKRCAVGLHRLLSHAAFSQKSTCLRRLKVRLFLRCVRHLLPLQMGDSSGRLGGGVARGCQDFRTPFSWPPENELQPHLRIHEYLLASMGCVTRSSQSDVVATRTCAGPRNCSSSIDLPYASTRAACS